ncbi:hypothetical protein CZ787_14140 [Halomonas citrativorans]|uniref:Tim44-like domain-containing protein n=1 Tax=Halomonas citrativorans TaxID=2742612 RepID=A0A1R4I3A0_9GAMM|nr:Tim44-like domain-containing protein [Halomonas citrativorans]SJN14238.1 hypothetical protein CZ787_14140 [Halomonas citrativorans]
MLRQLFVMLLVSVMGFSVAVEHAEARRMGGGGSMGSMSRSADRPASTPSTQQAQGGQQQGQAGAAAARRGGMGGMMGGLLAGGLIAALFFGGAFDELRMMDLLMVVGIAVLAMIAFRAFIRQRRPAYASETNYQRTQHVPSAPAAGSVGAVPGSLQSTPAWFDKEQFLNGAKEHFMTLQRAWDNNDFSQIQEYVTPELYNLLRTERAQHRANNRTDIVRLLAELGDINEYEGNAEASVIFHGIIEENGEQTEFNESWHLTRAMRDQAPWYVQGIEQNPGA